MQYGQDYMPRYRVGEYVTVSQGLKDERTLTITDRVVYRSKAHPRGDTYYRFDDGTGAWEWNVQPISAMVTPEQATARIIGHFDTVIASARMFTTRTELTVTVDIERGEGTHHSIDYRARVFAGRMVELIGEWQTSVNGNYWADHDSIGAALVETYNATLPATEGV